jgi:hypothetical protein
MADEETIVRYTYRLEPGESGPCAECIELDLAAEGTTPEEAVEALREALYHRLVSPDAVAPPSLPGRHRVVLVEADPSLAGKE